MTTFNKFLYGFVNLALLAAGLANLVAGTLAAFGNSTATAATSLTAGIVLLFAATIDRFESLKGLGMEAKTRKLDQKIEQADEALKRLREITEITGSALIDLNSKLGRWDSVPSPRESIAFANRVRQIMKSLGSEEKVIANVLRPWAKTLCSDMAFAKTFGLRELLDTKFNTLENERINFNQSIAVDDTVFRNLCAQIQSIQEFQRSRLNNFHLLELEDYPDKFMEAYDYVPQIDPLEVDRLRVEAARFVPGMNSLRQSRTLPDSEMWIEALSKAR